MRPIKKPSDHGRILEQSRLRVEMPRTVLAKILGCSDVYLFRVERGQEFLSDQKIHQAAEVLDIDWIPLWRATGRDRISLSTTDLWGSQQKLGQLIEVLGEAA